MAKVQFVRRYYKTITKEIDIPEDEIESEFLNKVMAGLDFTQEPIHLEEDDEPFIMDKFEAF